MKRINRQSTAVESLIRELPVESLGLSIQSRELLRELGVKSIADMFDRARVPVVGDHGTDCRKEINAAFRALLYSLSEMDWNKYRQLCAKHSELPILPSAQARVWTGKEFSKAFPKVVKDVMLLQFGPRHLCLVERRMLKHFDKRLTLEQVGQELGVSRERVKRMEQRIVVVLRRAFLFQDYRRCHFRIRPEFSQPLTDLVSTLQKHQPGAQITAAGWAKALRAVWNVDVDEIANQESLILQIMGLRVHT